MYFPTDLVK